MIDKAYEGGLETPIDESIPETMDVTYKLSEHAQKAVERVKNYQEKRDTGYYNDMFSAGFFFYSFASLLVNFVSFYRSKASKIAKSDIMSSCFFFEHK